jgi:hypothetical protein
MKQNLKKYRLFLLLQLIFISAGCFAQSSVIVKDSLKSEQLFLISDRDIYCVEETMHVKVYNLNTQQTKGLNWSNIVYCDLVTPDGRSVAKDKFLVSNNSADGNLFIPRNVISGNYYLRTYTKWMRNQSPYSFNYKQIKIINPFNFEVLTKSIATGDKIMIENLEKGKSNSIIIKKPDSTFLRNNTIQFEIKSSCVNCIQKSMTISVVRKGTNHSNYLQIKGFDEKIKEVKYVPETRGGLFVGKSCE